MAVSSEALLSKLQQHQNERRDETMSLGQWLDLCRDKDSGAYDNAAARLLKAIGKPRYIDTSRDQRLGRIFGNASIRTFDAFEDFFGMEEQINRIISFLEHARQGLEESRQILYLLGPVGSAKSSLAERLKSLMEVNPIYVLKAGDEISPIFESPLSLFDPRSETAEILEKEFGVPRRLMSGILSPWAAKRLKMFDNDYTKFEVVKMYPSRLRQIGIAKTEPGDENNQDISALVGKVDIRKLDRYSQNDPDAYSYSGALNRANQGIMEFVEMFKAPIKMLHPLLTATQEKNYIGTENIGALPFSGIILAHSNETEWQSFKNNPKNEAFIDRINTINIPYCLRISEEVKIYEKLIGSSELADAPIAPETLEMLARFSVLTRLKDHPNSKPFTKMRIYDGEGLRESDNAAKTYTEYKDAAGPTEGMEGSSTRWAYKVLAATFNHEASREDPEIAADPIHLMYQLELAIKREQLPEAEEKRRIALVKTELAQRYVEFIGNVIQKAYLESYAEYGQNRFDRYIDYADAWIENQDFKDADTGQMFDKDTLDKELQKIEKLSGIANPKDFRNEVVKYALRYRSQNDGKNPPWTSYEKMRKAIEKSMFAQIEDLLPVIAFGAKKDGETDRKHKQFVARMSDHGYTERQTRRQVEWYIRAKANAPG